MASRSSVVQQVLSSLKLKGRKVFRIHSGAMGDGLKSKYRVSRLLLPAVIIGWQKETDKLIGIERQGGINRRTALQEQPCTDDDSC